MSPQGIDFSTDSTASEVIAGLRDIGYRDALLETNYEFRDWFGHKQERIAVAAAFGQTPVSYETACIGVVYANGLREQPLVNGFRSLGAPILLEIDRNHVREWAVSRVENHHSLIATYPADQISSAFAQRAPEWRPEALLRAKNIGSFHWTQQLSLFSGLLPELETQISEYLDPLLRETLSATKKAYVESTGRPPNPAQLFKLVFWILTAKVFHDRRVPGFVALSSDPDDLLHAVAKQYKSEVPKLLNREARQIAAIQVWKNLDFRNLSVEVLSQIWSTTLVDTETKRRLGIHRTPRTIVRYIEERISFSPSGDDNRIVFEPCCGSAAFLVGAMNMLRDRLFGASAKERHDYFVRHLAGIEYDPFGVEISALALTLADFPNPNGWDIAHRDVFAPGAMTDYLRRAAVVLCNPPFERFSEEQRQHYQPSSYVKPAELLNLILDDLHPGGVIGFVLPRVAVDGKAYASVRERLAKRFASIELTVLPDRAFESDAEVALLVANDPISHVVTHLTYRAVRDDQSSWDTFVREHEASGDYSAQIGTDTARSGFALPALPDVWSYLVAHPPLGSVAEVHRGIEWRENLRVSWPRLVRREPAEGYRLGVPPRARFNMFEKPQLAYLNVRPLDQLYRAFARDWDKPKAILNKTAKSRGRWRIAAFPDRDGVVCYQTFFGVWPKSDEYDEVVLAAILNSPVANAFVSSREGKTDITLEILELVPAPILTRAQRARIHSLVERYQAVISNQALLLGGNDDPERILKEIDALVLDAYRMPPRLERQLLDYFRGCSRPVSHSFSDYIPENHEFYFSLSSYLDPRFSEASAGKLLRTIEDR